MTHDVVTVRMDDSLKKIRKIFKSAAFHHVLVMEGQKLVGVISDRDLLRAISPYIDTLSEKTRDADTLSRKAHQIMSRKIITVNVETAIETAAGLLLDSDVSCLPVVSLRGDVKGIVTWKDILMFYLEDTEPTGKNNDE